MTPTVATDAATIDQSVVCPYLGRAGDPATHLAYASSLQRCHSAAPPVEIDPETQTMLCLTARHSICPRYQPPGASRPEGRLLQEAIDTPDPEPVHLSPLAGRRVSWSPPSIRRMAALAVLAALLAAIALSGQIATGPEASTPTSPLRVQPTAMGTGQQAPVDQTARVAPSATVAPGDISGDSAAATSSPDPTTPTSTPKPPAPTEVVTPRPGPVRYVVRRGDTLTAIARRYGVSVAALLRANVIEDPNLILTGQRLVIPVS